MLAAYVEAVAQLPFPIRFQVGALPFGTTRSKRGSTHGLCNGGTVQNSAVASPYARKCWICARTPVRASGNAAGVGFVSVAPIPAKLFVEAGMDPLNRNHAVSTMLCMKATSPVTPSAAPSSMKYRAIVSSGTVAAYVPAGRGCRLLNHATICSADSRAAPMMDTLPVDDEGMVGATGNRAPHAAANTAMAATTATREAQ